MITKTIKQLFKIIKRILRIIKCTVRINYEHQKKLKVSKYVKVIRPKKNEILVIQTPPKTTMQDIACLTEVIKKELERSKTKEDTFLIIPNTVKIMIAKKIKIRKKHGGIKHDKF